MSERNIVLVDPLPRTLDLIMEPDVRARLERLGEVIVSEDRQMPNEQVDALLADTVLIFGQTDMPKERLDRAPKLKAIINVESNFMPNIDYQACVERGIWVITPASAFSSPVAEASLGMALDLARGITIADRQFRDGVEEYGLAGNTDTFRYAGAPIGIIGFGDLGKELRELTRPFKNEVHVYDPWLPKEIIERLDCVPSNLDDVFSRCRVVYVFASVTSENQGFIGKQQFDLMQPGSAFLLMSRAAVVDFPAMLDAVKSGHIRAATDVFPEEPVAADDPVRSIPGLLLSAHRSGGTRDAFYQLGSMAVADAELIMKGLPPQLCRRADPATASRLRSKPVSVS
ncbi:putative oxidoreductase [Agrobacterium rubi TR3 = NBRC 13261]|uniref:Putative oxidoreductase n=1 Tax=Agrobacterium rubi TR3 = NBRC 13261 TaxID=1368415 RepID=A0A081CTU4_9HYPH|nr:hydroxyacid dehydrogenase [Agrobacterium rubi]MBP1878393.1 phosphoglycerate dehydrogenase-like enzyme [Agrobacterium rubi]GAK70090.1 putative oxidoreductase [Agrobacterium rubi TR3 = NBRC 13261]